ncbi:DDB1- and CUL4-associated factor 4 [Forsythia ovata]|uniref:peroxidase n=1 Tax=Forsythia ovata TaxID=205694 RepID=A0ABD1QG64_9LAMI
MPKEIPGFYYDAEKNRYFPYKGPIPGSSRKPPPPPSNLSSKRKQIDGACKCMKMRRDKLLQAREVCGNVISSRKGKLNFQMEYQKRYGNIKGQERMGNAALEHVDVDVTMPHGVIKREILLAGSSNGSLRLFQAGKVGQELDPPQSYMADCVWPLNVGQRARKRDLSRHLLSSDTAMTYMPSSISCIKMLRRPSFTIDNTTSKHILIATLGSDRSNGLVYLLDLSKPLDFNLNFPIPREGFHEVVSFKHTLWAADCGSNGRLAAIGTNRGAALLNLETGRPAWMYRCKSDVLSIQLDHSGNFILCGLRNGAIVTVDARQKQLKRNTDTYPAISMPSSVCCLSSLKLYDQYFLASSMDGSFRDLALVIRQPRSPFIPNLVLDASKYYITKQPEFPDQCKVLATIAHSVFRSSSMTIVLTRRGPIQSYDGNINSHTRLELGVDPSEKFVLSGGEDCYLRLWNIQSGKMLFEDRFMEAVPSVVCWPRMEGHLGEEKGTAKSQILQAGPLFGWWDTRYRGLLFEIHSVSLTIMEPVLNSKRLYTARLKNGLKRTTHLLPALMRLHFHDCSVRGCDASILLNHKGGERIANASKSLRGFEVIDDIKAEVEKKCPKIVSCADILTAAARDATVAAGGPFWMVPYGRKDGRVSVAHEADLVPMGHDKITDLIEFFQSKGLNVLDLVVLSGAHTIGRSTCGSLQNRLFNYKGTGKADPSINHKYLNFLRRKCRWASEYVELDAVTPKAFDVQYYKNLEKKMGLLSTDQMLYFDSRTAPLVTAVDFAIISLSPSICRVHGEAWKHSRL